MLDFKLILLLIFVMVFTGIGAYNVLEESVTEPPIFPPPQSDLEIKPMRGYWNYSENGEYCILSAMAARLTFLYEGADGEDYEVSYDVPANQTLDRSYEPNLNGSFCEEFDVDAQRLRNRLRIHFFEDDWILELDFFYDYDPVDGDREWYMADIDIYYTYNNVYFPMLSSDINMKQHAILDRIVFFFTDLRNSYWCDSEWDTSAHRFQFYSLGGETVSTVPLRVTLSLWDTRLEAFAREDEAEFHAPNRCSADQFIPKIVPAVIGGFCAATVIFTLAMYSFIRRAKGRDYVAPETFEPDSGNKFDQKMNGNVDTNNAGEDVLRVQDNEGSSL